MSINFNDILRRRDMHKNMPMNFMVMQRSLYRCESNITYETLLKENIVKWRRLVTSSKGLCWRKRWKRRDNKDQLNLSAARSQNVTLYLKRQIKYKINKSEVEKSYILSWLTKFISIFISGSSFFVGDTHTNCINHDVNTRLVATFSTKESLMSGTIYRLQLILLLCQLLIKSSLKSVDFSSYLKRTV